MLAANTSYQGFPRLAAVLARDRFFPRQFVNLGDRLVYSNGIIVLAGIASLLIWVFHANVISLIHLYVIGVFTAFTLSQAGMVRYWLRRKERGWRKSAFINGFGACGDRRRDTARDPGEVHRGRLDGRDRDPALIAFFLVVNRHYRIVTRRLQAGTAAVKASRGRRRTASSSTSTAWTRRRGSAAWYAQRDRRARAITRSGSSRTAGARIRGAAGGTSPAAALASSRWRRSSGTADAVLDYVWALPRGESNFLTVVVPEQLRAAVAAVGGRAPAHDVLAEAAAALRAGDRDHERARGRR